MGKKKGVVQTKMLIESALLRERIRMREPIRSRGTEGRGGQGSGSRKGRGYCEVEAMDIQVSLVW